MSDRPKESGPSFRIVIAQTTNPVILNVAQNGGVVTGLLTFALERKMIDGAIVSAMSTERPLWPVSMVATTTEEILESAGTRYTYLPNVGSLSQAAKRDLKAIAFVGTPCQIAAVRRMQEREFDGARPVKLLIGLMCSEAFSYEGLMVKHVQNTLGVDLGRVRKIQIAGDKMMITTDDNDTIVALVDIKKYSRKSCEKCSDFSSELADISAGGLGLGHWTLVIVRTPIGEEIFTEAERAIALVTRPVQTDEPAIKLLMRLSSKKRQRERKF